MSVNMTDISKAQIGKEERIELENMAISLKLEIDRLLDDTLPISTRIQAMKAAGCFIYGVDDRVRLVVFPHVSDYLKGLISVARKLTSEKDVYLVLRRIDDALVPPKLDDSGTDTYLSLVTPFTTEFCKLIIPALIKFRNELRVVRICGFIFDRIICETKLSEEVRQFLLASGLIPTLAIIMMTHSTHQTIAETKEEEKESFVSSALNILCSVTWWCHRDHATLISILVETAFPVFHSILNSTAECIICSGTSAIVWFLRRVGKETIGLKFVRGESGLRYILRIVAHILNLSNADRGFLRHAVDIIEYLQAFVGENCELGEGLDEVSTAALNTLRNHPANVTATTKLLLIFSLLIKIQCDAVLNSLSKPDGSTGQNSLRFVIVDGLCGKYVLFEDYDRTTVKQALVKIDKYGLDEPEPQLDEESLEEVRALLLSLNVGDDEDVVDETLANHECPRRT